MLFIYGRGLLDLGIIWLWCTRERSSKVVMKHVLYESSFLQHTTIQKSVQTQSILALGSLLSHFSSVYGSSSVFYISDLPLGSFHVAMS